MTERGFAVDVPTGYTVGPWRIDGAIATGSWGSVYAATRVDRGAPATAACKFLPGNALSPAQRTTVHDLAHRERAFSSRVHSDHLIRTYEVLEVDDEATPALDGCTVIVMERARTSLRELLAESGGAVSEAVPMLTALAEALDDVHSAGWVHGDVSPSNVLLMDDGTIRLSDFGLSAELDGTHAYVPHLGSFDYTPAEWWSEQVGDRGVEVRPGRDIWSFGVIAHQVLTGGRHPFPGADSRTRALAVREYATTGQGRHIDPGIAAPWRRLIEDALDADPVERGRLTGSLAVRVRLVASVPVAEPVSPSPPEQVATRRSRLRRRAAVLAAAAAVVAGCAGAVVAGPYGGDETTSGDGGDSGAEPARPGEIAAGAAVPGRYRDMITSIAHRCADPVVTPALIAAILAAESGFDPRKKSPSTGEYGIALWTPALLADWADNRKRPHPSAFNARDSIRGLKNFLCWAGTDLEHVPLDDPLYRAAAYRTSTIKVSRLGRIPPAYRDYIDEVDRHLKEFAVPE